MMNLLLSLIFVPSLLAASVNNLKDELHRETSRNHRSYSYREARRIMFNQIHLETDDRGHFITGVYCNEKFYPFQGQHPGNRIPDSRVMNTEHTWPQSKFTRNFSTEVQKTDLHHLYPTLSRINSERGNHPFAEVYNDRNLSCDDSQAGRELTGGRGTYFEPPQGHKGNVARSMFYFSIRYKTQIDPVQEQYLRRWHEEDPVDHKEQVRNEIISRFQNNRNPFIDKPELVSRIRDF